MWKEWEMNKLAKRADVQIVDGKGGEENHECDGRTALIDIWKEWEENAEQQEHIGVEY